MSIEAISTERALKLALEALKCLLAGNSTAHQAANAITALRQAIEQAEKQEPVAWQWLNTAHFRKKLPKDAEQGAWTPLYTAPPQRQRVDNESDNG
jgi:hypothetical protein